MKCWKCDSEAMANSNLCRECWRGAILAEPVLKRLVAHGSKRETDFKGSNCHVARRSKKVNGKV